MMGPKKQDLWPRINISKGFFLVLNKNVQKLTLEKNIFNEKWSPKLIFSQEKKNKKNIPLIFDIKKLTLKVQFWHFLSNCHSSTDLKKKSFEYVDSRPKFMLFRTHHHWNFTTELVLSLTYLIGNHQPFTGWLIMTYTV